MGKIKQKERERKREREREREEISKKTLLLLSVGS